MIEVYPKFYAPYERKEHSKLVDINKPKRDIKPYMTDDMTWTVSEKLNGINTRIIWDGYSIEVKGRNDKTELQGGQLDLQGDLIASQMDNGNFMFDELFGTKKVTIFGEVIGTKIQGNPYKLGETQFKVFDILINDVWVSPEGITKIAEDLNMSTVMHYTVRGWDNVMTNFIEIWKNCRKKKFYFEGLVAYPAHQPLTKKGERVITKIKVKDFDLEELENEYTRG